MNPNRYRIEISDSHFRCVGSDGAQDAGFSRPVILDKLPKLYVVRQDKDILYIGITSQDIRKRLRYGFTASGENGYHGYKWKHLPAVELLIWSFPDGNMDCLEAIEGELVYLIRNETGKWPKYQMEIHFHQASESEMQIANSIFRICMN
jgi:hypothetical protein